MKKYITLFAQILLVITVIGQNVGINTTGAIPDPSAMLDVSSTTKGLLIPRLTSAQRVAIVSPANGLMVYDNSTASFWYYNGSAWEELGEGDADWAVSGNDMYNTNTGGVGINTTLPGAKLHVVETSDGAIGLRIDKSNGEDALRLVVNNTTGGAGNAIDVDFMSNTSTSSAVYVKNYGGFAGINLHNYGNAIGLQVWQENTPGNTKSAMIIHNEASGKGLYLNCRNTANADTLLCVDHRSLSGSALGLFVGNKGGKGVVVNSVDNGIEVETTTGTGVNVFAQNMEGVYAYSGAGSAWYAGVYGEASTGCFAGVLGSNWFGADYGVFSDGDYGGSGAKYFVIDHPLDPENKLLKHFSTESDEPLLIYRGKATFDVDGNAVVQLKDYVQAINVDYTYNLTPVGRFMPVYVHMEVSEEGVFEIRGGEPGEVVCWTLYGQRHDAYFDAHPEKLDPEVDKPEEMVGFYLDSKSHDQPDSKKFFLQKNNEIK
jgi:hypothetical protein